MFLPRFRITEQLLVEVLNGQGAAERYEPLCVLNKTDVSALADAFEEFNTR